MAARLRLVLWHPWILPWVSSSLALGWVWFRQRNLLFSTSCKSSGSSGIIRPWVYPNKSETEEGEAKENKPNSLYLEACRKPWEELLGVVMKVNFASVLGKRKWAGKFCSVQQSCAHFFASLECSQGSEACARGSEASQLHSPGLADVFTAALNEQENPTKFFFAGSSVKVTRWRYSFPTWGFLVWKGMRNKQCQLLGGSSGGNGDFSWMWVCVELVLQCSVCLRLVVLIPTKAEALSLYCAVNLGYLLVPMSFFLT